MARYYIDIDGTLTDLEDRGGNPIEYRIDYVRRLSQKHEVVLWSGGGSKYARSFAKKHRLLSVICVGKPDVIVDDRETIRPEGKMRMLSPVTFFGS